MGSEMCIRDSLRDVPLVTRNGGGGDSAPVVRGSADGKGSPSGTCLLYTSDAADERSSVDLGGRRIIKKKKAVAMRAGQGV